MKPIILKIYSTSYQAILILDRPNYIRVMVVLKRDKLESWSLRKGKHIKINQ